VRIERACVAAIAVAAGLLLARPAPGEIKAGSHELAFHAGSFVGDEILDEEVDGESIELGSGLIAGASYAYNVIRDAALELRYSFSPNKIKDHDDFHAQLHLVELSGLFHINPTYGFVGYATAGGGGIFPRARHTITGTIEGEPRDIDLKNSVFFSAGLGAKIPLPLPRLFARAEARYRFIPRLIEDAEVAEPLNTIEVTFGLGRSF
jgi:hypothetical protein